MTADAPEAYGYTIFCDDIRAEVDGKVTYVGAYSGTMFVRGTFPVTLPKFALGIVYLQRHDKVMLPITFHVFLPEAKDEPSIVAEMSEEAARSAMLLGQDLAQRVGTEAAFTTLYSHLTFAPFRIAQLGLLRVRAVRGDHLIRLGTLQIVPPPEQESPSTAPPP